MANLQGSLQHIDPDKIKPNPDNPRLIFREDDMNALLESIKEVGIKVPLSVYQDGAHFVLVDGERRWRCSRKLNLGTVPALVQPKPGKLENILTMFNIHNVRRDWDLMPIAIKLGEVKEMLIADGRSVKPRDLAGLTGLSEPTVRRALELLELPKKYQRLLLTEAERPKDQQSVTADLFVEINKSRRVAKRYVPEVFDEISERKYVDAMVDKYRRGVTKNVVRFRDVSKIARAERAGGTREQAAQIIIDLVTEENYSVEDAFDDSVKPAYDRRDLISRSKALAEKLQEWDRRRTLPDDLRESLITLRKEINRLIRDA